MSSGPKTAKLRRDVSRTHLPHLFGARVIRTMFQRRANLVLENLALRQQVTALKKERPRPLRKDLDRAVWVP